MSMKSFARSSSPVCFESLESRRLMSAVPASVAMADWAEKAAAKVHLTVPHVSGAVFTGVALSGGGSSNITLTIVTEGKTGKLTGTLIVNDGGNGNGKTPTTFAIKGSVNVHGVFTFTAAAAGHQTAKLTGSLSADGKTVSGNFSAHKPKHPTDSGTFTATRA
jgi:hypothetical protein